MRDPLLYRSMVMGCRKFPIPGVLAKLKNTTFSFIGNNSRKNKGRKRGANGLHTQNNPTAGSNFGHDLPVNQPSQHQNRRSLEEKDIEKKLSSVLSSLTKSQLDILQNGSPSRRSECDPKFVDSANI